MNFIKIILIILIIIKFVKIKETFDDYNNKSNILIITRDDRNLEYINEHDKNINKYCLKHNYVYKRIYSKCVNYPIYWCKLYDILEYLNDYDYVIWMDSDTHITQLDRRLETIISKDITIGKDYISKNRYNAGFFVIKNSKIGKEFLIDCLNYFEKIKKKCVDENNNLLGQWSGDCYEQGVMNKLLHTKYKNYVNLSNNIYNGTKCLKNYMIVHTYLSSSDKRLECMKNNILKS